MDVGTRPSQKDRILFHGTNDILDSAGHQAIRNKKLKYFQTIATIKK